MKVRAYDGQYFKHRKWKLLDCIKIHFIYGKWWMTLYLLQMLALSLLPVLKVLILGGFIDTALAILQGDKSIHSIYILLGSLVAVIVSESIISTLSELTYMKVQIRFSKEIKRLIIEKIIRIKYKYLENNEACNEIKRVTDNPEIQITRGTVNSIFLASLLIHTMSILTILIKYAWWTVVLILLVSYPLIKAAIKSGQENYGNFRELTERKRRYQVLSQMLISRETINERSLFGYSDTLNKRWLTEYESTVRDEQKVQKKWFINMKLSGILVIVATMVIVITLLPAVLHKKLSIGLFMALVNALLALLSSITWSLADYLDQLFNVREFLKDLTKVFDFEEEVEKAEVVNDVGRDLESIEFKDVYFAYPGTERFILKGINFKIEKGKSYAFVGVNGAGKTSIIKLLTGLYDNYTGSILINGKELRDYSYDQIRSFFSIVHQDFAKYQITLRENIEIGDLTKGQAPDQLQQLDAVVRLADLKEKVDEIGLDAMLGKIYDKGTDLSGGQWQRIAIARSLYSDAPVRVFDEPTAALDPISESKMYFKYKEMCEDKTAIMISHRLGSTKLANTIFVIEDGIVIEQGNHEELMAAGGRYNEMFSKQKEWYDESQCRDMAYCEEVI